VVRKVAVVMNIICVARQSGDDCLSDKSEAWEREWYGDRMSDLGWKGPRYDPQAMSKSECVFVNFYRL